MIKSNGEEYTVERIFGDRQSSKFIRHGAREELVPSLESILGSVNNQVFSNIYAFGLRELRNFSPLQSDSISSVMYGATVGTSILALPALQDKLKTSREILFKSGPMAKNSKINKKLAELQEVRDQLGSAKKLADSYDKLKQRYDHLSRQRDKVDKFKEDFGALKSNIAEKKGRVEALIQKDICDLSEIEQILEKLAQEIKNHRALLGDQHSLDSIRQLDIDLLDAKYKRLAEQYRTKQTHVAVLRDRLEQVNEKYNTFKQKQKVEELARGKNNKFSFFASGSLAGAGFILLAFNLAGPRDFIYHLISAILLVIAVMSFVISTRKNESSNIQSIAVEKSLRKEIDEHTIALSKGQGDLDECVEDWKRIVREDQVPGNFDPTRLEDTLKSIKIIKARVSEQGDNDAKLKALRSHVLAYIELPPEVVTPIRGLINDNLALLITKITKEFELSAKSDRLLTSESETEQFHSQDRFKDQIDELIRTRYQLLQLELGWNNFLKDECLSDASTADKIFKECTQELGKIESQLKTLESSESIEDSRFREESLKEEIYELGRKWSIAKIAQHLLDQAKDRFERDGQPEVIREASKYFQLLTGNKYERIALSTKEKYLVEVIPSETQLRRGIKDLSTATQEQLYLALRFGFVKHQRNLSESIPLIMDDIIVNFDNVRAKLAVEVLSALSTNNNQQVFYFTCHKHTIGIFKEVVPELAIIEIENGCFKTDELIK